MRFLFEDHTVKTTQNDPTKKKIVCKTELMKLISRKKIFIFRAKSKFHADDS